MKRRSGAFTLVELMIVLAVIGLLAGLLLPALVGAREQSRRKSCSNNLGQIGKACVAYQEPNGDYFPAFMQQATYNTGGTLNGGPWVISELDGGLWWANQNGQPGSMIIPSFSMGGQGSDGTFQPMPSLACLYPSYLPEVKVFACPSTTDTPQIAIQYYKISPNVSVLHTCFGFASYDSGGALINTVDPAAYTGNEVSTTNKCSYLYDELTWSRDLSVNQALAADADGQTWPLPGGGQPPYPHMEGLLPSWARAPHLHDWPQQPVSQPNHDNGQNVMYVDGHVKWTDTVYCGQDPADNIFCPQAGWGADTDAYLWDGVDSRAAQTQ